MDLLTLEEVLQRCEQQGLEVSERTFRYYSVLGLLPRPTKRPTGDARIHYYEPEVLERLAQIRNLQAEGHSLKQVKKLLEVSLDRPSLVRALAEGQWQEAVRRYLRGNGSRESALQLTQELLTLAGLPLDGMSDRELDSCIRHFSQWHGAASARSLHALAGHSALPGIINKVESVDSDGLPLVEKARGRLLATLGQLAEGRQLDACARALEDLDRFLSVYESLLGQEDPVG